MRIDLIEKALKTLQEGGTLLYPTDTVWGIGCDACCHEAVEKIYTLKKRDHNKSMLVLANERMLSPALPIKVREMLLHSKQPTTVIVPTEMLLIKPADNLPAADNTIGVRAPHFSFCEEILNRLGHPIVSTSANLSGRPSPSCYAEIEQVIKDRVDYALPNDESFFHPQTGSSRIVKIGSGGEVIVLRG